MGPSDHVPQLSGPRKERKSVRDCNNALSTGALSLCMMQTKPLNPHTLLCKAGRLTFERGTLSPPLRPAGFPAEACPRSRAVQQRSQMACRLELHCTGRLGARQPHFRTMYRVLRMESAFPDHWDVAAQFCLATATRSRQSTVE